MLQIKNDLKTHTGQKFNKKRQIQARIILARWFVKPVQGVHRL